MSDREAGLSCTQRCWALALLAGIVTAVLMMLLGDWRFIHACFSLVVVTIILGAALQWWVCTQPSVPVERQDTDRGEMPLPESRQAAMAEAAAAQESARPVPSTPSAAAASAPKAIVQPTKALPGEADLSARKGQWKYEVAAPAPDAKDAADGPDAASSVSNADAPERLNAPPEGGSDNLTLIKGVGPKLEKQLHSMGIFLFEQIASWSDKEVAWVDANLEGFRGRVTRDGWVEQAKTLASGGSTEFSEKSKKDLS